VNLFYQPATKNGDLFLDVDESRHCVKILRKKNGDTIFITDGKGSLYEAEISNADERKCSFRIVKETQEERKCFSIHIAISPTKNTDRFEWFVEKAVEIGIDEITPLICHRTERQFLKRERLEKLAISAMKQSLKYTLPTIHEPIAFDHFLRQIPASATSRFIAFVDQSNPSHLQKLAKSCQHSVVMIGPEGDFTEAELTMAINAGFTKVSLGKSRLRTETAGIAACHILNLLNS
jgi:16S rRNA (uracil1498-N3)-methyltransferase